MAKPQERSEDMKQRVNRCMIKLSDRDTEAMAVSELESLAKSLTPDSLPSFLSAISDTRPTDKTPLRRHSLRLISLLSLSHPPSSLLPLLPRMLSAALRRLRDSDSSVRAALVDAVRSLAASLPSSVSSTLLRPLADSLLHEQELAAQTAAALSLAAAVDAASAADPDLAHQLHRLLPRLVKLARSNAFKAKPALISLLGSAAAAGGASTPANLGVLVPFLVGFLGSEDWSARKAAAEALTQVAVRERESLGGFRSSYISTFESRRFDKVKIVRDSMNRMLEAWKDIPDVVADDDESNVQSNSSCGGGVSDGRVPAVSGSSPSAQSASPFAARKSRFSVSRSPPPSASPIVAARKSGMPNSTRKLHLPSSRRTNYNVNSDWKVQIAVLPEERKGREQGEGEGNVRSKVEAKRLLFEKNCDEKGSKLGVGLKSASRVVPFEETGSPELVAGTNNHNDEIQGGHKDGDLSLIRMQLVQIENQQSSLLDLLQRFIGSSQTGIHCLESRVHGLEMALDEISRDIAVSSGRLLNSDSAVKTCCSLPGAEFLSSKFWRRTDGGRYSLSGSPTLTGMRFLGEKQGGDCHKQRFGIQSGLVVNPLAEINPQSRGNTEVTPNRMQKSVISATGNKHGQAG